MDIWKKKPKKVHQTFTKKWETNLISGVFFFLNDGVQYVQVAKYHLTSGFLEAGLVRQIIIFFLLATLRRDFLKKINQNLKISVGNYDSVTLYCDALFQDSILKVTTMLSFFWSNEFSREDVAHKWVCFSSLWWKVSYFFPWKSLFLTTFWYKSDEWVKMLVFFFSSPVFFPPWKWLS